MLRAIVLKEVKQLVDISGAALDRSLNMGRGKPNMFLIQNYAQDLGNNVRTLLNGFGVSPSSDRGTGKDDETLKVILEAMQSEPKDESSDALADAVSKAVDAKFKEYMPKGS